MFHLFIEKKLHVHQYKINTKHTKKGEKNKTDMGNTK